MWRGTLPTAAILYMVRSNQMHAVAQPARTHSSPINRSGPRSVVLIEERSPSCGDVRRALAAAGLEVVGEAETAGPGVRIVLDRRPDVVVVDLALTGTSGVEAIEQISILSPTSRILVLTAMNERDLLCEAIVAGASSFIQRALGSDAISKGVRAFAAGECVISSPVAGDLLAHIRERDISDSASERAAEAIRAALTKRELQIFRRLASGESNQAIGQAFCLSENTVKNHVASILAKLQVENRIQAAVRAVRSGMACVTGIFVLGPLSDEGDLIPRAVVGLLLGS